MGRNKGDSSRSKFRSSSSSKAASLLQTPVASAVGFGGFVGSSRVDVPPSSDGEHLLDIDGDAALQLKRLSKKDPTTKLKALAALAVLFKERPVAELSALLPHWVFEYKRLVQDSSRQVRESAHIALTSLATSVGRGLAPHLRSLMGPWWVAQFDPSREVSAAAQTSFQVAFSGQKKRVEALMFCENEVFSHIDENLKLTPQTISDKTTPIEEASEKHERVVSCSLLSLAALIDVLVGSVSASSGQENTANVAVGDTAAKTRASIREAAIHLCWNHKFLQQHVKAKSSRIRSAAYQALRAFIQCTPEVFRDEDMDLVVPSILGTFLEKDPACHQPMWDMLLLFAKGFPQAWDGSVVSKVVLPRLWGFLRHGCYGSQQISYPYLLPLISLIPPKAIVPAKDFLYEFFNSLWQGRTSHVGLASRVALLKAVQECLMWTVLNAKRFSDAEGYEAAQLQIALIDGVLLKLLWHDFMGANTSQIVSLPTSLLDINVTTNCLEPISSSKASEAVNVPRVSPDQFAQELGSCIVQAIEKLSVHGDETMGAFWDEFQDICFQVVQEAGSRSQSGKEEDLRVSKIAEFFMLLGSKTSKGKDKEQWSLIHAVRPFVAKSFPAIRSLGHPESIRLIAKLTSIYGPTAFSLLSHSTFKECLSHDNYQGPDVQDLEDGMAILQYFKENLVPWCLDGSGDWNGPKAELILAFIENPMFQQEWEPVISHITSWQEDIGDRVDVDEVEVLATLLEKVRERSATYRNDDKVFKENAIGGYWWISTRIDGAVIRVASSSYLAHPASLRLLRTALGGTSPDQPFLPIVSDKAGMRILEELLVHIVSVLSASATNWIRSAPSVIMNLGLSDSIKVSKHQEITMESLQLAVSAINVLGDCIFSLKSLDSDQTVGGKLLASIFCLNWACSDGDLRTFDDGYDSGEEYGSELDSEEETGIDGNGSPLEVSPELKICGDINTSSATVEDEPSNLEQGWGFLRGSLLSVHHKISPSFCRNLTNLTRFRLRQVLITCLRLAILDDEFGTTQRAAVRCAVWAQEVVGYTCEGQDEVSEFVDFLLAPEDSWPYWVILHSPMEKETGRNLLSVKGQQELSETQIRRHDIFCAFADQLCRSLSPQELFLSSPQLLDREIERGDKVINALAEGELELISSSCRIWLVVELLCTWEWFGGSALRRVLPFLWSLGRSHKGGIAYSLLWNTTETLFIGSSNYCVLNLKTLGSTSLVCENSSTSTDPFLRALLVLLKGLLEKEDGWSKTDARNLFRQYVTKQEAADWVSPICSVHILPQVLYILMPILRKKDTGYTGSDEEWQLYLQTAVSVWLQKAIIQPPLVCSGTPEISGIQWIRVAVACFPLNSALGVAAMASASSAPVTSQERELLLALLQKQFSREAIGAIAAFAAMQRSSPDRVAATVEHSPGMEVTLAKLVAATIGYCWLNFGTNEWEFILKRLRGWLEAAVVEVEEFTEAIVEVVKNSEPKDAHSVVKGLENVVTEKSRSPVELSSTAVAIFSLLRGLGNLEGVGSTDSIASMKLCNWESLEMRALEDILRMFLAIGLAESAAVNSSVGENGGSVIALWRKSQSHLWDNVAEVALCASSQAREAAIRAVDLWGVGNGAISSLYALLFSQQPTISLQWAAYQFLSTGQILQMAVTYGIVVSGDEIKSEVGDESVDAESKVEELKADDDSPELPPALVAQIRPELASVLQTAHSVILRSPLTSSLRVSYLLGWSLLLTRLQSLKVLSPMRERIVQYIQDSDISPTLLNCLFQHIQLEQNLGISGSRKRNLAAGQKTSRAAAPATRGAATGSVGFAVEGLWPVQKEGLATLAGAIYGLMLLVLPACVRIWFTGLRDKPLASAIEAFTTTYCSPQLLADEFSQVQASAVDEENLSIRANRSLREVTAIYTKEEAGMDIVIRIPSCYPLRAVDVECTRRMGINETLLRKWILSMASFLRNQNGAVAEAVLMWKKNVDREFEGVEECPICYSIIHTSNHNLPRLACKTCRHKFHSACLYKWFSTSHQSKCPLCKTPF